MDVIQAMHKINIMHMYIQSYITIAIILYKYYPTYKNTSPISPVQHPTLFVAA